MNIISASAMLVMMLASALSLSAAPIHSVPNAVPDRYVVALEDDTPASQHANEIAKEAGARVIHVYDAALNGFSFYGSAAKAAAIARRRGVKEVWAVGRYTLTDVQYGVDDGLDRIDQRSMPLNDTFNYYMLTTPVNIYILDSGVDPTSELTGRLTNVNFATVNNVRDPNDYTDGGLPLNEWMHGTGSAIIAAGSQSGVARFAKVFNVRVCVGGPTGCNADDILAGIDYVMQQRNARPTEKHIANGSYAGNFIYDITRDAYINSFQVGVAWIFSAGNMSADACDFYPARLATLYSGVMSIGAARPTTDEVEVYSNQGGCVDVFAPSISWVGNVSYAGTSIAAPFVTGAFAVRWATSPASNSGEIEGLIKGSATVGVLSNVWPTSPNLLLYSIVPKRRAVGS